MISTMRTDYIHRGGVEGSLSNIKSDHFWQWDYFRELCCLAYRFLYFCVSSVRRYAMTPLKLVIWERTPTAETSRKECMAQASIFWGSRAAWFRAVGEIFKAKEHDQPNLDLFGSTTGGRWWQEERGRPGTSQHCQPGSGGLMAPWAQVTHSWTQTAWRQVRNGTCCPGRRSRQGLGRGVQLNRQE